MPDEGEIMDEIHGLDGELKSFPETAHWFCPQRYDDDPIDYENPAEPDDNMTPETKQEMIEDAKKRHEVAYKFSMIIGVDTDSSGRMLDDYIERLNRTLSGCDKCVRNWHRGRKPFLKELAEIFDEDIAKDFSHRLNDLDFARINRGLKSAHAILQQTEPQKRTQSTLAQNDQASLMAVYEALCSVHFLGAEMHLTPHFNYVFEEIQSRKVLRIGDLLPAMAQFLFDLNPKRLLFAQSAWKKGPSTMTTSTFDWVVRDALLHAIARVAQPLVDLPTVLAFWSGFLTLLDKMDEQLVKESLRELEVQPTIYELLITHIRANSEEVFILVVQAFGVLLKKSPNTFWSAMGTISPVTVAEQIFQSDAFMAVLSRIQSYEQAQSSAALTWIPGFISSLPAVNQYDACRSLLFHLFERLQDDRYSTHARFACCHAGLSALSTTLQTFLQPSYVINPSTSLVVINDVLGLVSHSKETIMPCADLPSGGELSQAQVKRLAMEVIRDALALDCKAINAEYNALHGQIPIQSTQRAHSQSVWQGVLDIFRPGNLELAKNILSATAALVGLDKLLPANRKDPKSLPPDHIQFNLDYKQLNDNVSRIFERLSDFEASDLRQLYQSPQIARPLFGALVSADKSTYEAAVEVIKAMTGESNKQDAMKCLLEVAFSPFLGSITYAVSRIIRNKTFSPIPYMLKIGKDVLEALCGNTGVLRTLSKLDSTERNSIMAWWSTQWRAIDVVFSNFETWYQRVDRTMEYLQELIRDAMEYSNALFDQHTILATAIKESTQLTGDQASVKSVNSKQSVKRVLETIRDNIDGLAKMIRLRDAYLLSITTRLLVKLLGALGEYDLEIGEVTSEFIKGACSQSKNPSTKTNLTNTQKAELQRALDEHQGIEFIEQPAQTVTRQLTIDSWSKPADPNQSDDDPDRLKLRTQSVGFQSQLSKIKASGPKSAKQPSPGLQASLNRLKEKGPMLDKTKILARRQADEDRKRHNADAIAKARALRGEIVKGEGSGVQSIGGIVGKDHAPIRSEIMVGSSDEESDEDEDDDDGLLINRTTSKSVAEYEESRRLALLRQNQGPVKKTKIQRSVKDLRARVEPNMDKLYLEILNWDIFHTGDSPPSKAEYLKIDNKYLDLERYKRTFGPLLLSEVWRSLATAKEEITTNTSIEMKVLNRLSVDKFMEISTSMPMSANLKAKMSERDIVLLSKSNDPLNSPHEPHCLARIDRTTKKKDILEVTYRVSRDLKPEFLGSLTPSGKIYALKIADMTTTQREYAALSSLEYYDLCPEVLEAKPSPIQKYGDEKIASVSEQYNLNRGQAQAILSANDNDGFTLIQGPPGSGKTKTIIAMVGALLTQSLREQSQEQHRAPPPIQRPGNAKPASSAPKKKLLICAPSNAAVDELVVRLKEGIQPLNGVCQKINVIRIGRSDAINASVKDVMLDELVRVKMEGTTGEKDKLLQDRDDLHKEAGRIKERLNLVRPAMDAARASSNKAEELKLQREFDDLKRQQARIGNKIDEDKESGNSISRTNEINRRKFQQEIIDGAHVLCATLSGSGHDMFRNLNVEFETVIIDEAAQCIELSALIPLKYGCSKCILVGDPEQLPPTVLSRSAQSFGYEQSLFVRMQKNHPKDIHLLDTQYRMHPEISAFPSKKFYNSRLLDGEGMAKLRSQPWHASTILGPYRFFHVDGIQSRQGHSLVNVAELDAAVQLYARLKADYKNYNFKGKIGIISTYKGQLIALKDRFERSYGNSIYEDIEFNTTDAFQGREREIIIFSCVRAKATGGIGFLSDIRRMNVGLTRAKSSLWVLGDANALAQGEYWRMLIEDARARNRFTGDNVMSLFSKPTARGPQPAAIPSRGASQSTSRVGTPISSRPASALSEAVPWVAQGLIDQLKGDDSDVEMMDATSVSSSRKSSPGSVTLDTNKTEPRKSSLSGTMEDSKPRPPRKSTNPGMDVFGINQHGKRSRDIAKDDNGQVNKKAHVPDKEPVSDLEAAYLAKQAAKPAPPSMMSRPSGPGIAPPRKKAPADPFIQRKKPQRRG